MEFRQIVYAMQVAELKSFSRAAEALHIAQPSLSQQVAKLEQELGIQLFDRTRTPLAITYAGERFIHHGIKILDIVEQLQMEMRDLGEMQRGRLVVGSLPMTGTHILPLVLSKFRQTYPGIEVLLVEETTAVLEELTAKGKIDISLLSLPLKDAELEFVRLIEEPICLAIPPEHPLANRKGVELQDLSNESFIFLKTGQGFRQISFTICRSAGFEPKIVFESANIDTVQSLVAEGMGIAFVPKMVKRKTRELHTPHYLELLPCEPTRTLVCAYKKGRYLSKAALAFIDILQHSIVTIR